MKIRLVEAELFHVDRRTDGRTDMTKLIVAFRNFANAPKKIVHSASALFMCFVFISGQISNFALCNIN